MSAGSVSMLMTGNGVGSWHDDNRRRVSKEQATMQNNHKGVEKMLFFIGNRILWGKSRKNGVVLVNLMYFCERLGRYD